MPKKLKYILLLSLILASLIIIGANVYQNNKSRFKVISEANLRKLKMTGSEEEGVPSPVDTFQIPTYIPETISVSDWKSYSIEEIGLSLKTPSYWQYERIIEKAEDPISKDMIIERFTGKEGLLEISWQGDLGGGCDEEYYILMEIGGKKRKVCKYFSDGRYVWGAYCLTESGPRIGFVASSSGNNLKEEVKIIETILNHMDF